MDYVPNLGKLKARKLIPAHYGSFPMLAPDAKAFLAQAKKEAPQAQVVVMKPGDTHALSKGIKVTRKK